LLCLHEGIEVDVSGEEDGARPRGFHDLTQLCPVGLAIGRFLVSRGARAGHLKGEVGELRVKEARDRRAVEPRWSEVPDLEGMFRRGEDLVVACRRR